MTLAHTRKTVTKLGRSPEEMAEDAYDALPTRLYHRIDRSSGLMRAAPRELRGLPPSYSRANAPTLPAHSKRPSHLATFSLPLARSQLPTDVARISEMLRDLPFVAAADASRPLTYAPGNVFLTPPDPSAPAPMWSTRERHALERVRRAPATRERLRTRRSILPFITTAMALAIAFGLWRDDAVRAQVASDLAHAVDQLYAFVVEAASR